MNANEALDITKRNWQENEKTYLASISGFQMKVAAAASEGRAQCAIGVIPSSYLDFVSFYFEGLGFFVFPQPVSQIEMLITLNWKNIPNMSVGYLESLEEEKQMEKFLDNLNK